MGKTKKQLPLSFVSAIGIITAIYFLGVVIVLSNSNKYNDLQLKTENSCLKSQISSFSWSIWKNKENLTIEILDRLEYEEKKEIERCIETHPNN